MTTDTGRKIINYIKAKEQTSVVDLINEFHFSRQAIQKQLKKLVAKGALKKIGAPPKVYYILKNGTPLLEDTAEWLLNNSWKEVIQNRFLYITPSGEKVEGIEGFVRWCQKRHLPPEKTAIEYIRTLKKYDAHSVQGLIDGLKKLHSSFKSVYLDKLFYLDFYSIERFGKTKLGQMLLYAKQSQNREFIQQLIAQVRPQVKTLITTEQIDAVGFIPPTVKRTTQFMHVLEEELNLSQKIVSLTKVTNEIAVPQKTLTNIEDRIENAHNTILLTEQRVFQNILLIDDAVGSGATLNEVAKKIRTQKLCTGKIIGLALTGSYKGFDIISEV